MTHFAIHIDNIERAKNFYAQVFDWGFASYGAPDFLQIKAGNTENGELIGALQARTYSPVKERLIGLECTGTVENVDYNKKGSKQRWTNTYAKDRNSYVGWITKFLDTEGNLVCAMQSDSSARG